MSVGTRESWGHPTVLRGIWNRKDSGPLMSLLGHGSPGDIPQSQGDFGMGRTVVCWDMGVLRTSHSPKGTLGWEGQWDC